MLDTVLLFMATSKVYPLPCNLLEESGMRLSVAGIVIFAISMYGLKQVAYALPIAAQFLLFIGLVVLFVWAVWNFVLDNMDRGAICKMINLKKILEKAP